MASYILYHIYVTTALLFVSVGGSGSLSPEGINPTSTCTEQLITTCFASSTNTTGRRNAGRHSQSQSERCSSARQSRSCLNGLASGICRGQDSYERLIENLLDSLRQQFRSRCRTNRRNETRGQSVECSLEATSRCMEGINTDIDPQQDEANMCRDATFAKRCLHRLSRRCRGRARSTARNSLPAVRNVVRMCRAGPSSSCSARDVRNCLSPESTSSRTHSISAICGFVSRSKTCLEQLVTRCGDRRSMVHAVSGAIRRHEAVIARCQSQGFLSTD